MSRGRGDRQRSTKPPMAVRLRPWRQVINDSFGEEAADSLLCFYVVVPSGSKLI